MLHFTILEIILCVVITYALITDLKTGKIYNHLTFPAILLGIVLNYLFTGTPGLVQSLYGTGAGFLLMFIPYLIGWQGAGDVKLVMAIGSIMGLKFLLIYFVFYMIGSFFLSLIIILAKILSKGKDGKNFLSKLGIMISFGIRVDNDADKEMLKTNVKWSPAIFIGTILALLYTKFI